MDVDYAYWEKYWIKAAKTALDMDMAALELRLAGLTPEELKQSPPLTLEDVYGSLSKLQTRTDET